MVQNGHHVAKCGLPPSFYVHGRKAIAAIKLFGLRSKYVSVDHHSCYDSILGAPSNWVLYLFVLYLVHAKLWLRNTLTLSSLLDSFVRVPIAAIFWSCKSWSHSIEGYLVWRSFRWFGVPLSLIQSFILIMSPRWHKFGLLITINCRRFGPKRTCFWWSKSSSPVDS